MPQEIPDLSTDLSLGFVVLPKDALEQDWKVTDGYIAYSAELLRLSLLAITGIAAICLKLFDKGKPLQASVRGFALPLAFLLISSGCALAHRYVATDSMYWHIEGLRRTLRRRPALPVAADPKKSHPSDEVKAATLLRNRNGRYKLANYLLVAGAFSLLIGVALSAIFLAKS
jgi:hypothetical protein